MEQARRPQAVGTDTCYIEEVTKQANLCSGIAKSLFFFNLGL